MTETVRRKKKKSTSVSKSNPVDMEWKKWLKMMEMVKDDGFFTVRQ